MLSYHENLTAVTAHMFPSCPYRSPLVPKRSFAFPRLYPWVLVLVRLQAMLNFENGVYGT